MTGWRDRIFGTGGRLGWWTLPVFLAVGMVGAVLAGTLAVVYYSQQVSGLRAEIRDTAARLDSAVEEVEQAREDAVTEIEDQLDAVRDALARGAPVEDAEGLGVALIRVFPVPAPSEPQPGAESAPPAAVLAQDGEPTSPDEPPAEQPPPPPPPRESRAGSGFAVVQEGGSTFFVTTFALVADPNGPNGVVPESQVTIGDQTFPAAVHSWDASIDLALVRMDSADVVVATWRPQRNPIGVGDRLFAVGLSPSGATTESAATVAALEPRALLTDLVAPGFVRGGPLVDIDGRVVAIVVTAYRPFGDDTPPGQVAVPIAVLCEQLLACGPEQLGSDDPTSEPTE